MENDKHNKMDKIIGWLLCVFLSVVGSTAVCGIVYLFMMLALIVGEYTYGIIFVVMFIVFMRFFLRIANWIVEDDEVDES